METGTVCGGRIELDHCTECDGSWFDAGELESLSKLSGVERVTKPVCGFRSSRSRSRPKAIVVTVEADHPVGPSRSGRSDAGLLLV